MKTKSQKEKLTEALETLRATLRVNAPKQWTAKQLAKRLRCTRATIYNRLEALHDTGFKLKWGEKRDGARGPLSATVTAG